MLEPVKNFRKGATDDFVPQAIFALPMSYFSKWTNFFYEDHDDLDYFCGTLFMLDDKMPVEIKRYAGFPDGLVSMYLSEEIEDLDLISNVVSIVSEEFGIDKNFLVWQRGDSAEIPDYR